MSTPMTDKRFGEIGEMRFTTGFNAACMIFDTPVEEELYREAVRHQNARVELLHEASRLRAVERAARLLLEELEKDGMPDLLLRELVVADLRTILATTGVPTT